MEKTDIDDIFKVINGCNNELLSDNLKLRTPVIQNSKSKTNCTPNVCPDNKVLNNLPISMPTDPVKSVSSSDSITTPNVNLNTNVTNEQLNKMLSLLQNTKNLDINSLNEIKQKTVNSNNKVVQKSQTNNNQKSELVTNIFGCNVPTSTIYFVLVLSVIAVGLYFMTAKKRVNKKKKKNKDDE